MKSFSPPYRLDYFPRFHPDDSPATKRVRSYYRGEPVGITVYVLNDNTVTQTKPRDEALIKATFRGGYRHDIADDMAAILIAAGYTVNDPPYSVPDVVAPQPTPRPAHPVTWQDLHAYTWQEARQFLWGGFYYPVPPDVTVPGDIDILPEPPATWDDLTEFTWTQASKYLWGSFQPHA